MSDVERMLEEFEVSSADGQRVRMRKSVVVHVVQHPDDPTLPHVKLNRTVYCGIARGGLERPAEPLGDDRFRIGGTVFSRHRSQAVTQAKESALRC